MIRIPLYFYTTIGFVLLLVDKAMGLFLRASATRQLWLALLGWTVPIFRRGRELVSKGVIFFFRGPLLVRLSA
jgi:hypothetical protein